MFVSFQKELVLEILLQGTASGNLAAGCLLVFPMKKVQQHDKGDRGVAGGELEDGLKVQYLFIVFVFVFVLYLEDGLRVPARETID